MKRYSHYSFDLLSTFFVGGHNKEFDQALAEYFFNDFNPKNSSIEDVQTIIGDVFQMCKVSDFATGKSISGLQMCAMVLHTIGFDLKAIDHKIGIEEIYRPIEYLFRKHPPIIHPDTEQLLKTLKNNRANISILSDTGFIEGKTYSRFLKDIGLKEYITFEIYSGDVDMSKPNESLYLMMIDGARRHYKGDLPIKHEDIVHVGRNSILDGEKVIKAGIHAHILQGDSLLELTNW